MYLSKLELHGFKSFAERTVVHFDPGITSIVGPNGCGKSNIVDAVRWVIGEQRARILRSEKMENVIFNGTSKRRPLGMAEVQLTIENTRGVLPMEYSEVKLGRRLFRSGDSEYLMNGVQCRLKDITDLFMDTGMGAGAYSVIELKMIEDILSENAEDRRRLFEEAAGITKYKIRRRQTLGKLDSTQADLTRIRDLTEEIGKQVRSLKRQAEKASRYKEYSERLHRLELTLAHLEHTRLSEREKSLLAETAALQAQIEEASAAETAEEANLSRLRKDLVEAENGLSERQRALNAHLEAVRSLETERRLSQERLEAARRDLDRTRREQESAAGRRADLEQDAARLETEIAAAEPALADAEAALHLAAEERDSARSAAEAVRSELHELRRREREAEDERSSRRRALDRLTNRLDLLGQEEARIAAQSTALEETASEMEGRTRLAERNLEEARATLSGVQAALEEAEQTRQTLQEALQDATDALHGAERRREATAAEVHLLEGLISSYEDFSGAVQYLAASTDWTPDALRTVADLLACDDDHRIALDAALGAMASCIVVRTEDEARQAVSLLRREEKGQTSFIVLDRLRTVPAPEPVLRAGDVYARSLAHAVRLSDPSFRPLADLLLHRAYVVDTLEEAREAAAKYERAGDARFYARTGEWADTRGLLHGGSVQTGPSPIASRLGRREQYDAALENLALLDAEVARLTEIVRSNKAEVEAVPLEQRRAAVAGAERAAADAERAHSRLAIEQESLAGRQSELATRAAAVVEALDGGRLEAEALAAAVQEAELSLETVRAARSGTEEAYQKAEFESRAAVGRFNEANIACVQARNRRDNFARELDRTRKDIADLAARAEERSLRIADLESSIAETAAHGETLAARLGEIEEQRASFDDAVASAEGAVRARREDIAGVEGRLREIRRQRDHLIREENQRAVHLAEVHTRIEDLVNHIQSDFGVVLTDADIEVEAEFDEKEARVEVQELRRLIRGLGGINELALEAYEEEKERFEFLTAQQADLEDAEEKLLEAIDELNTTASRRFLETFAAIEVNFTRIFAELFGADAAAHVVLEDPNDPLESTIDITAKPRGKRPSSIAQLSGGEKTLTAIALLFAIYLVKPSPFCILDEVDAPLDDANVERFMHLIRSFSGETQFILVTHNKRTMEAADRLYGITMQEQGVSRLVGVRFDEAMEMAE